MKKFIAMLFSCLFVAFAHAQTPATPPTQMGTTTITTYEPCLKIGDPHGGGIVAYLLLPSDPGYSPTVQHGLIAAPQDYSVGNVSTFPWSNLQPTDPRIYANTSAALGSGFSNTFIISNQFGNGNYAAKLCLDLVLNNKDDWFLPSKIELVKLCESRTLIGGFFDDFPYWSSTDVSGSSPLLVFRPRVLLVLGVLSQDVSPTTICEWC